MDAAVGDVLGAEGIVDVGCVSDARLSALAPSPMPAGSWWAASRDAGTAVGDGGGDRGTRAPDRRHLAAVRRVLAGATSVLTWTDGRRRGAFVVAGGAVLLDQQVDGVHHLTLADAAAAAAILAIALDPLDLAVRGPVRRELRRLSRGSLRGRVLPAGERRSVVRLARVVSGPPPGELVLTVVGADDGVTLWRADPDGTVVTAPLDRDAVVALAVALLADGDAEVAA